MKVVHTNPGRRLTGIDHPRGTTHEGQADGAPRTTRNRDDAKQIGKSGVGSRMASAGVSLARQRAMATSNTGFRFGLGRDASGRAMCCPKNRLQLGITF